MATAYLLNCHHCQTANEVETRHAGTQMTCRNCQRSLDIPKLRELRNLPLARPEEASARFVTVQNPWRGTLFVGGILALLIGGATGWVIKQGAEPYIHENITADDVVKSIEGEIDKLSHTQLWDLWTQDFASKRALPEWQEADWRLISDQAVVMRNVAYVLLGLAGLGLAAIISSAFLPNKKIRMS